MSGARIGFMRRRFLGVDFTPIELEAAAEVIAVRAPHLPFAYVVTPNAQHTVAAHGGDVRFLGPQSGAWMVLNDSRILSLLARLLFHQDLPLAAGSDLAQRLFEIGMPPDARLTLIGGDAEIEAALRAQFGLCHIMRHTPPMGFAHDPVEVQRCVTFVRDNPARYVFLIVGAPQSEMLAQRLVTMPQVTGVGLCVGSALHFVTGRTKRAPPAIRRANLEWAYRLAQRPVGHFRRVFVESAPILWIALMERARRQRDRRERVVG